MKIKLILDKFDTKQLNELKKITGKTSFELLKMGLRLLHDKICDEVKTTTFIPYANFGFPWWQYYKQVYDTKYTIKAVEDITVGNSCIQPWSQEPYSPDKIYIYRHPDLGPEPYQYNQYTTINPSWVTGPTYTVCMISNQTDFKFDLINK